MADRTVRVLLQGDASGLVGAARQAQSALRDLSNTNLGSLRSGMQSAASGAREAQSAFDKMKATILGQVSLGNLAAQGIMSAFRAIKDAIGDTIKAGADYQTTLNIMGAVSGATADQMVQVSAKARELGKDITIPGTSATDAARAMTELAKGGFSVADSMSAAKGTLQLAAAAQIDSAKAAEIQVNAMAAFHIGADQAAHVADVLANVSNAASGEMTDFAAGLTAAGSTAHSFGISLEDTNTVLGLFANAGIKGEEGGTLFKTMLTKLAAPSGPAAAAIKDLGLTVYDASGKFVGMSAITDQLRSAHERLTTAAYNTDTAIVFGTRGIKGAAILGAEAADAFGNMSDAINKTGTAEQIAAAKMEGFNGALENLTNQWQDIQLQIFDKVGPGLTDLVSNVAGALPAIADAALGGISYVGGKVGEFLGPLIDGAKSLVEQAAPYVQQFATSIENGVTSALDAIAPFGEKLGELFSKAQNSGVLDVFGTALLGVGRAFEGVMKAVGPVLDVVGKVVDFFANMPGPIQTAVLALGAVILLKGPIFAFFDGLLLKATQAAFSVAGAAVSIRASGGIMAATMDTVKTAAKGMWAALGGWVGIGLTALITAFGLFSSSADKAAVSTAGLSDAIDENTGRLKDNADAIIAKASAENGSYDAIQAIGGSVKDYTDALQGNADAQDKVHTLLLDQATAALKNSDAWQQMVAKGGTAGKSAREVADGILATGDAGVYASDGLDKVLTASQHFAADSDTLATAQSHAGQAITAAGTAAGEAAPSVDTLAQNQQVLNAAMAAGSDPTLGMKDALKDMKDAADEADTAGQFLWATLEQLHGGTITAEQATRLENAAFRDMAASARDVADAQATADEKQKALTDAVNKYGSDSPQAAQASRDLAAANDAVSAANDKQFDATVKAAQAGLQAAGSAYTQKAALGDLQGATDDARAKTQEARDQFIKAAEQMGYNADEANHLADQYHLIPDEVVTTFTQNGAKTAQQQVEDLNAALDKIKDRTVHYTIVGDSSNPGGYQVTVESTARAVVGKNQAYADGGQVSGAGTGRSDSILARVSNGEFIVNAAATARNLPLLHAINNTPGFANGGLINAYVIGDYASTDWAGQMSSAFADYAKSMKVTPTGGNVNYSPSAGVEQWRGTVLQALALTGQSPGLANTVLYQMQTESGGNPNAINNWDCVPLDTMILTDRGWLKHDQVEIGDRTIGYNSATGKSEWTTITRVVHYKDAPLVTVGNKRWKVTSTPNHRWLVDSPAMEFAEACSLCEWPSGVRRRGNSTNGGLPIHMRKIHGVRAVGTMRNGVGFRASSDLNLNGHARVIVSAKADTGSGLPISDDEAELLGWIIGDGHLEQLPNGRRSSIRIGQSKPAGVAALRVLANRITPEHVWYEAKDRPGRLKAYTLRFSLDYAESLLSRSGYRDHEAMVLGMSESQRDAFLRGVIGAEGTSYGEFTVIPQKYGAKHDAIKLAVYLSGRRPSVSDRSEFDTAHGWNPVGVIGMCRPVITPLEREAAGTGDVWCVTTELGTWTAEQDGQYFLTGNSNATVLHDPSRGLLQTIMSTFQRYRLPGLSDNIYDPLSNIVAAIRYTIAAYGGVAQGMQGHAYATGGLVPGYAPGQDSVAAWLSPGEAVISRMDGYKDKNKALLDTAASWFGGTVSYPDSSMPPVGFGGQPAVVHHHYDGASYQGGQHGGIHIENLNSNGPGDVVSEIDYAMARAG